MHIIAVKSLKNFYYFSGGSKEIGSHEDIEKFRNECGASSVMLARAAMWNCSILRPEGFLPLDTVVGGSLLFLKGSLIALSG